MQKKGWLGVNPEGVLLDFKAELSRPFGVAFERSVGFYKDQHAHDRMVICAARGATRAEVCDTVTGKTYINSNDVVIVKPAGFQHTVTSLTSIYENLALLISIDFVEETVLTSGFNSAQSQLFKQSCRVVRRSEWLEQLLQQYFTRRILRRTEAAAVAFLEHEILVEIITLTVGSPSGFERSEPLVSPGLERAIEIIEACLFEPLEMGKLTRMVGMSQSTLQRAFNNQVGMSLTEYLRSRRLDEASRLFKQTDKSVSEVAQLVGYSDASAFARAFRRQFGSPPRRK